MCVSECCGCVSVQRGLAPRSKGKARAELRPNTQDCSPLGWTGWISLQSKGLSRVFSNTTVQKHQFFSAQPSLQSNSHLQACAQHTHTTTALTHTHTQHSLSHTHTHTHTHPPPRKVKSSRGARPGPLLFRELSVCWSGGCVKTPVDELLFTVLSIITCLEPCGD